MNLLIALLFVWVFSFTEDIWFNRLLSYQLSGEAERLKVGEEGATNFFKEKNARFSWLALAIGLSLIAISFPNQFTVSLQGASFVIGVLMCLGYIGYKIVIYMDASKALKK